MAATEAPGGCTRWTVVTTNGSSSRLFGGLMVGMKLAGMWSGAGEVEYRELTPEEKATLKAADKGERAGALDAGMLQVARPLELTLCSMMQFQSPMAVTQDAMIGALQADWQAPVADTQDVMNHS